MHQFPRFKGNFQLADIRDVLIIGSAISNSLHRQIFCISYRISLYIKSPADIIGGQLQVYWSLNFWVVSWWPRSPTLWKHWGWHLYCRQPTLTEVSICIYNLTDDEIFELWDSSNLVFATFTMQRWFVYYIRSVVCLSVLTFGTVSVIGISVISHIGTSLADILVQYQTSNKM